MRLISPFPLLRDAWQTVRSAWLPLVSTMLAFQIVLLIVVSPLIGWLFREALRANGMFALDFSTISITGGLSVTLTLLVVILLLAFWVIILQFAALLVLLSRARNHEEIQFAAVARSLGGIARKLVRPSSFPLFLYLFFILPLSGFGFVSVLSQGIAIPSFISGELMKSPMSSAIWAGFMLLLTLLNLRFAVSIPIFLFTQATGGRAMRLSWRVTRGWASVRLALAALLVLITAAVVTLLLVIAAVIPTAITDELWPAASPAVAAFSLGLAQLTGLVLTALVTTVLGSVLLALMMQREDQLPAKFRPIVGHADPRPAHEEQIAASQGPLAARRRPVTWLVAGGAVVAVALGFSHLSTMQQLSSHPETLALGHRGFSGGGAENTLDGLEAAAAAGADLVEIDVMQTADRRFVVMHDANLMRLAGQDLSVKDLTLDELTRLTVRDQFGHEGKIPSLEEYVLRAAELEMPLLMEVKLGGLDTPDHVDLLIAELERLNALDGNIFHTLDAASVTRLKELRPDATVGYILAFAGVDIPETEADFVVIEQWSATQEMQDAATRAGLGFFSWTVNDEAGIRELLRRDADGLITDHPDVAIAARAEMQQEVGLAGMLFDALSRFVVVF